MGVDGHRLQVDERRLGVDGRRRNPDDTMRIRECGCMPRECGSGVFMYVRIGGRVAQPRNGATCHVGARAAAPAMCLGRAAQITPVPNGGRAGAGRAS